MIIMVLFDGVSWWDGCKMELLLWIQQHQLEVLAEKLKDAKLKGMVNELLDACVKITEVP